MDLRQMRYFVTIAEEGKITAAAKKLNMAQPPLSKQLKQLEEELGILLFERHKKSISLTAEGEVFLKRCKELLGQLEETITEVREMSQQVSGTLSVGCTLYCASQLLAKVTEIRSRNPQLTFKVWEGEIRYLCELLESRQIEVAITSSPVALENVSTLQLPTDPFVAVLPKEWSPTEAVAISLQELAKQPLILLLSVHGEGMYDRIVKAFEREGLQPNILFECHDSSMLLSLVTGGFGATLLPQSMLSMHPSEPFTLLPIEGTPLVSEPMVIWRAGSYLSKSAREFLRLYEQESTSP